MISLTDFKVLPFNKKCDFITVFADYIVYRVEDDKKYYLYHMQNYFVEVCYAPKQGKVLGIHAFKDIDLADPYLEFINITDLYL